jgi:phosphatidylglycerol lysyltransferase
MRSLKIGEDAIVDTELFSSKTSKNKHFRAVRNKFVRLGYRYEISEYPHTHTLLRETARVSKSWLGGRDRRERGFALGYYDRGYMNRTRLHLLYGPDDRLVAFANEIASYDPNQATIDLMRHTQRTETGAMDYLQMRIIEQKYTEGIPEFSLGMAPLAGLMDEESRPIEQRFLHYIAAVGVGGFSYEGLRRYKNKFEPRWEDRYMAYASGPVGFLRSGNALNSVVN